VGYGLWSTEKNERGESGRRREQTKGRGRLSLECYFRFRVTKKTCYLYFFFFNVGLVEPVRFGSVQSVSDFENRNRTEPIFFVIFQSVNSVFFFGSVLLVVFFPVFSV
jgi:hypothetical protein